MKTLVASLVLAGTLVTGTLASAQEVASVPAADTPIMATFYDGNPFGSGEVIEDEYGNVIEVSLTDSPIAEHIDGLEDESYVVLEVGDQSFTFDTLGGDATSNIHLEYDEERLDGEPLLHDALASLTALMAGDAELAVFTDADGVVTGLYRYAGDTDGNPNIDISSDTAQVTISRGGELLTFETSDSGAMPLRDVSVTNSAGEVVSLASFFAS